MSVTQNRKDRERAQREELILDHARRLLVRDGFQDLNLDELARNIEYSKGTIYLHFETKEDLVLSVATQSLSQRADLFDRASKFTGKTRERIRAIGFACCHFAVLHKEFFNMEMMLKSPSFWERASVERRRLHGVQSSRLFHTLNGIVLDAIRAGDLPPDTVAQEVSLSLIAVTMGSHIVAMQHDLQMLGAIHDPISVVRRNQDLMCDGWNWKPLLKNFDYASTDRRIKAEIFSEATWWKPK
jgi:AcrR family transcriptional regulator